MGFLSFVFRRHTPYSLRKDYDKLREKADKIRDINQRVETLRMLDQIEPSIVSIEEHHMSGFEKKRTMEYIDSSLRKIKFLLNESKRAAKEKKEEANYLKDSKSK